VTEHVAGLFNSLRLDALQIDPSAVREMNQIRVDDGYGDITNNDARTYLNMMRAVIK